MSRNLASGGGAFGGFFPIKKIELNDDTSNYVDVHAVAYHVMGCPDANWVLFGLRLGVARELLGRKARIWGRADRGIPLSLGLPQAAEGGGVSCLP